MSDREENEDMDEKKPDWMREIDGEPTRAQRVHATLAPPPEVHYPAPWRVAELNERGRHVVECADGSYTAECPTREAAEAIVLAVNTFAGVA